MAEQTLIDPGTPDTAATTADPAATAPPRPRDGGRAPAGAAPRSERPIAVRSTPRRLPTAPVEPTRSRERPASGAVRVVSRERAVAVGCLVAAFCLVLIIAHTTVGSSTPRAGATFRARAQPPRYWTVRPGQSLSSIAARESVSLAAIERANPTLVPTGLLSGQRVRVPG